jgi:putative sigma-54 modulation protein
MIEAESPGDSQRMNVEITARHERVGKRVKDHATDRIEQALRHADGITSVHCVLDSEKGRHRAEIIVHGKRLASAVSAESADVWAAIDACAEKLRHSIEHRAGKSRTRLRKGDKLSQLDAEMEARAAAPREEVPEAPIRVIRSRAKRLDAMTLAEARSLIEDSRAEHVAFRDAKTDRVHVLYRRRDGQLGLLDTGAE